MSDDFTFSLNAAKFHISHSSLRPLIFPHPQA